jgi:DNA-binding transcriptional MerR regulator
MRPVSSEGGPWRIDDFARLAGTTGRNVRLYQTRGLLPPPELDGRVGLYNEEHLRRLRLILRLLERGYPLANIRELIDAWDDNRSLGDVLGFEEALAAFAAEPARSFTTAELQERFPTDTSGAGLLRAVELGLLVPTDGDDFIAPVPSLLDIGATLVAEGVPLTAVLDASGEIQTAATRLADVFVRLFLDALWQPFADAGEPAERWPEMVDALNRLRDLWPSAVVAALAHAMQTRVDEAASTIAAQEMRDANYDAADS